MTKIYIFKKSNGQYTGSVEHNKSNFIFDIQDKEISKILEEEINKLKPFRIIGISKDNKIKDFIEEIKPQDPSFLDEILKMIRLRFSEYHFVKTEFPISWQKIEDGLSTFIASDILDDKERSLILSQLPQLDKNQIILLHYLLKDMYNYYETLFD